MSLPAYPSYRDSGLEWLGAVPAHWDVKPIKAVASVNDEVLPEATDAETQIEYVEISDVQAGAGIKGSTSYSFGEAPSRARRLVRDGDIVVSTVRTYLRAIAQVENPPENMIVSTGFAVVRPKLCLSRFLGYSIQSEAVISKIIAQSTGISYPAINANELVKISLAIPPQTEQANIAKFLDRETSRIDALIEEQERLIALLKEKRQAVISHAVTKGLDPTAPTKDSGVEWLGEVPAHWEVIPLKRLATIRYGIGEPPPYRDDGVPLIRATNVDHGRLSLSGLVLIDPSDLPENRVIWLEDGDIIIVRSGAYTGDSAIIRSENLPAIAGFDMVIRPFGCMSEFLSFSLLSAYLKEGQIDIERMRAAQPHLNAEELGGCMVAVPSPAEQAEISARIEREIGALDSLNREAEAGTTLLRERRSALISAAVTGKIDVREFAPAELEPPR
ncbi:MAG: restriction endonuclease subunit S [Phenylobacterium sp.]|uniref:restriction endonuclease subunit S n=2 Tax=Phenylobacterium sp. TaxID=1871053 RepID=UPI0025D4702F|nr:restriction endonuclease subunit S [Phenylobacterium sp.]MCA6232975.1 restriction endonuclease subunit S [Phenylobacterium sp.]MCA6257254.1 restriction endonuclease subunit S [Phenylobacterium sp.]MCA6317956.1 restriction endonuclease subunit S [Phenylobacterium sp.]